MNKRIIQIILLFLFIQVSCDTDVDNPDPFSTDPCEALAPTPANLRYAAIYDKPVFTEMERAVFYSSERVEIEWSLPGDLWNTELQMIQSDEPFKCDQYARFHELNNDLSFGYGNQYVHYYTTTENFSPVLDSIYVSYRARATDVGMVKGYSKWTDVKSFTIAPLSGLKKETITVTYKFDFTTEEVDHFYYSGVTSLPNYRLPQVATDHGIDYDKIRLVRMLDLKGSFETLKDDGDNPFSRVIIGFNEGVNPEETVYPFEVIGEIQPGSFEESPVSGGIGGDHLTKNLFSEMSNYDLKLGYKLEDAVGSRHEIGIHLTFEIYTVD